MIGNAKGVVCAFVSVLVFHNPVTAQGAIGYVITIFGTILYSESKKRFKGPVTLSSPALDPAVALALKDEAEAQAGAERMEHGWKRQDSPNKIIQDERSSVHRNSFYAN